MIEGYFCGVEQEADIGMCVEDTWLPSGGRTYQDGGLSEINTALVPVTSKEGRDSAHQLYKAVMADKARMIEISRDGEAIFANNHFNFTEKGIDKYEFTIVLGPAFYLVFGRENANVGFDEKGSRIEIATGNISSLEGLVGGSAIGIAACTALSKGELSFSDFEYEVDDSEHVLLSKAERLFFDEMIHDVLMHGRDTEITTNKGIVSLQEYFTSVIRTLKPHIIKYCSEETYQMLEGIATGEVETDLDFDMLVANGDIKNVKTDDVLTKKNLLRQTGKKNMNEVLAMHEPEGVAKMFSLYSSIEGWGLWSWSTILESETNSVNIDFRGWDGFSVSLRDNDFSHIYSTNIKKLETEEDIKTFIKVYNKYKDIYKDDSERVHNILRRVLKMIPKEEPSLEDPTFNPHHVESRINYVSENPYARLAQLNRLGERYRLVITNPDFDSLHRDGILTELNSNIYVDYTDRRMAEAGCNALRDVIEREENYLETEEENIPSHGSESQHTNSLTDILRSLGDSSRSMEPENRESNDLENNYYQIDPETIETMRQLSNRWRSIRESRFLRFLSA